jgi:hypothetical protein
MVRRQLLPAAIERESVAREAHENRRKIAHWDK